MFSQKNIKKDIFLLFLIVFRAEKHEKPPRSSLTVAAPLINPKTLLTLTIIVVKINGWLLPHDTHQPNPKLSTPFLLRKE